jgi:hypothetical protein
VREEQEILEYHAGSDAELADLLRYDACVPPASRIPATSIVLPSGPEEVHAPQQRALART